MLQHTNINKFLVILFFSSTISISSPGCLKRPDKGSHISSTELAMVASSVMTWLLDKAIEVPLQNKLEDLFNGLDANANTLGASESSFSHSLAIKLNTSLDRAFEKELKVKLHALQTSLTQDYIPGLADSTTQLALMNDKANEIRSAIASFSSESSDVDRLGLALIHHRSYLLASSIKLYVQAERYQLSKLSLGEQAPPTLSLRKSIQTLAKETLNQIKKIETDTLYAYARAKIFTYSYRIDHETETFGFKQGVRFSYCVKSKDLPESCGVPSPTICTNELVLDCIHQAKKEAEALFASAKVEAPFMKAIHKDIFESPGTDVEVRLTKLTRVH